jgi:hypothetical protein
VKSGRRPGPSAVIEIADAEIPPGWLQLHPPAAPPLHEVLTAVRLDLGRLRAFDLSQNKSSLWLRGPGPPSEKGEGWESYFLRVLAHTKRAVDRRPDVGGKVEEVLRLVDLLPSLLTPEWLVPHPWILGTIRRAVAERWLDIGLRGPGSPSRLGRDIALLQQYRRLRAQRFGEITAKRYDGQLRTLVEKYMSADLEADEFAPDVPDRQKVVGRMLTRPPRDVKSAGAYRLTRQQAYLLLWDREEGQVSTDSIRKAVERARASSLAGEHEWPQEAGRRYCWCVHQHCTRMNSVEAWDGAALGCWYLVPKATSAKASTQCIAGDHHELARDLCDCWHVHCERCDAAMREAVPTVLHACGGK